MNSRVRLDLIFPQNFDCLLECFAVTARLRLPCPRIKVGLMRGTVSTCCGRRSEEGTHDAQLLMLALAKVRYWPPQANASSMLSWRLGDDSYGALTSPLKRVLFL